MLRRWNTSRLLLRLTGHVITGIVEVKLVAIGPHADVLCGLWHRIDATIGLHYSLVTLSKRVVTCVGSHGPLSRA